MLMKCFSIKVIFRPFVQMEHVLKYLQCFKLLHLSQELILGEYAVIKLAGGIILRNVSQSQIQ